jgi:hypothetical protein
LRTSPLREEHSLRVFENRLLKRTLGPKRDVTRGRGKFHNEELHNLHSSPNIIRGHIKENVKGRTCSTNGGDEKCVQNLVGKPEREA